MPVYICPANLIVDKAAVAAKYPGGIDRFRSDFRIDGDNFHMEDDQLFALVSLNVDEFDVDRLIDGGLHFDEAAQYSTDFVLKPRYGDNLWSCDWLLDNEVFAWHVNASGESLEKMERICAMTMDEIIALQERGEEPFSAIR